MTFKPFGIKPIRSNINASISATTIEMVVPSSDSAPIYINDIVKTLNNSDEFGDESGICYCARCTPSDLIRGIVVSIKPLHEEENYSYRKANTYRVIRVSQDPFLLCKAMVNDVLLPSDIYKFININSGLGNQNTSISEIQLDYSTINTDGGQFRITSILETYDSDDLKYSIVECVIQKHEVIEGVASSVDLFDRIGTTIKPHNAGDDLDMGTGDITATNAYFTGKLTVDGLLDPTAVITSPQSSAPTTEDGSYYYNSVLKAFVFRSDGRDVKLPERAWVVNVASDFPTLDEVYSGLILSFGQNVTDNDPSKTNTGQSFLAGQEAFWNGTNYTIYGDNALLGDDLTNLSPINVRSFNVPSGQTYKINNVDIISPLYYDINKVIYVRKNGNNSNDGLSPTYAVADPVEGCAKAALLGADATVVILDSEIYNTFASLNVPENVSIYGPNAIIYSAVVDISINGYSSIVLRQIYCKTFTKDNVGSSILKCDLFTSEDGLFVKGGTSSSNISYLETYVSDEFLSDTSSESFCTHSAIIGKRIGGTDTLSDPPNYNFNNVRELDIISVEDWNILSSIGQFVFDINKTIYVRKNGDDLLDGKSPVKANSTIQQGLTNANALGGNSTVIILDSELYSGFTALNIPSGISIWAPNAWVNELNCDIVCKSNSIIYFKGINCKSFTKDDVGTSILKYDKEFVSKNGLFVSDGIDDININKLLIDSIQDFSSNTTVGDYATLDGYIGNRISGTDTNNGDINYSYTKIRTSTSLARWTTCDTPANGDNSSKVINSQFGQANFLSKIGYSGISQLGYFPIVNSSGNLGLQALVAGSGVSIAIDPTSGQLTVTATGSTAVDQNRITYFRTGGDDLKEGKNIEEANALPTVAIANAVTYGATVSTPYTVLCLDSATYTNVTLPLGINFVAPYTNINGSNTLVRSNYFVFNVINASTAVGIYCQYYLSTGTACRIEGQRITSKIDVDANFCTTMFIDIDEIVGTSSTYDIFEVRSGNIVNVKTKKVKGRVYANGGTIYLPDDADYTEATFLESSGGKIILNKQQKIIYVGDHGYDTNDGSNERRSVKTLVQANVLAKALGGNVVIKGLGATTYTDNLTGTNALGDGIIIDISQSYFNGNLTSATNSGIICRNGTFATLTLSSTGSFFIKTLESIDIVDSAVTSATHNCSIEAKTITQAVFANSIDGGKVAIKAQNGAGNIDISNGSLSGNYYFDIDDYASGAFTADFARIYCNIKRLSAATDFFRCEVDGKVDYLNAATSFNLCTGSLIVTNKSVSGVITNNNRPFMLAQSLLDDKHVTKLLNQYDEITDNATTSSTIDENSVSDIVERFTSSSAITFTIATTAKNLTNGFKRKIICDGTGQITFTQSTDIVILPQNNMKSAGLGSVIYIEKVKDSAGSGYFRIYGDLLEQHTHYATIEYDANYGYHRVNAISGTGSARFECKIPADFQSLVSFYLRGYPGTGTDGSGKNIDLNSEYGEPNELYNHYAEANTTATYDLTGTLDKLTNVLDLSVVASMLNQAMAKGSFGFFVDHKTIGGTIRYTDIELTYYRRKIYG